MADDTPLVLVTRPKEASERFVRALLARRKVRTLIAPVIELKAEGDPIATEGFSAVIFTSAQAVSRARGLSGQIAYCVGEATARAARTAGFDAVSADGNADDLIARIRSDGPNGRLLHIRGADSVGDVASRLREAGIETEEVVAYRQVDQVITPADRAVIADASSVLAPVFSARSARRLASELGVRSGLTVIAISFAVAKAWRTEAARIVVADTPSLRGMVDAIVKALDSDSQYRA